jgi:hypothetical protein
LELSIDILSASLHVFSPTVCPLAQELSAPKRHLSFVVTCPFVAVHEHAGCCQGKVDFELDPNKLCSFGTLYIK